MWLEDDPFLLGRELFRGKLLTVKLQGCGIYIYIIYIYTVCIYMYIYIYIWGLPSCSQFHRSGVTRRLFSVLHAILEALPRQKFHHLPGDFSGKKLHKNIPPFMENSPKKRWPKTSGSKIHSSAETPKKTWSVGISRLDLPRRQPKRGAERLKNTHIRNKNPWVTSVKVRIHWSSSVHQQHPSTLGCWGCQVTKMLKGLQKLLRLDLGEAIPAERVGCWQRHRMFSRRIRGIFPKWWYIFIHICKWQFYCNFHLYIYTIYLASTLRPMFPYVQMHLSSPFEPSFDSQLSKTSAPLTDEEDKVIGCIKGKPWIVGEALLLLEVQQPPVTAHKDRSLCFTQSYKEKQEKSSSRNTTQIWHVKMISIATPLSLPLYLKGFTI